MINDNDALLRNRLPSVSCTRVNGAFARVTDGESFVHTHGPRMEGKKTICDRILFDFVRCKYKSVSRSPSPLRRLILTWCTPCKVSNARHRLDQSCTSHFYNNISFMYSCESENYHFTNDTVRWNITRTFGLSSAFRSFSLCSSFFRDGAYIHVLNSYYNKISKYNV